MKVRVCRPSVPRRGRPAHPLTDDFRRVEVCAPVALRLTPHTGPRGFVMDGADLALVDVEVVDAQGREIAAATNRREAAGDPTAHAEILALREAARRC